MAKSFEEAPFTPFAVKAQPSSGMAVFADEGERKRYTATALKAYLSLVDKWRLSGMEASALLAVSTSTWERIKRDTAKAAALNQDQLTRVSALTGIYKGLHLLFADKLADDWIGLANRGPLFGGQTPVRSMIEGGIPQMLDVRRHVDALRGGL